MCEWQESLSDFTVPQVDGTPTIYNEIIDLIDCFIFHLAALQQATTVIILRRGSRQ